jgi:hypothetical protein
LKKYITSVYIEGRADGIDGLQSNTVWCFGITWRHTSQHTTVLSLDIVRKLFLFFLEHYYFCFFGVVVLVETHLDIFHFPNSG